MRRLAPRHFRSRLTTYRPSDDNGIFFTDLISCPLHAHSDSLPVLGFTTTYKPRGVA